MNILIVTEQVIPHEGGLSTHVETLQRGLTWRGHQVRLVHGGQAMGGPVVRLARKVLALGSRDRYWVHSMRSMMAGLKRLVADHLNSFDPDLIHCHDVYAMAAMVEAAGPTGLPLVQTVHGPALYEAEMLGITRLAGYRRLIHDCERKAFAAATRLIAVDSGQASILINDYQVPSDKVQVIFNCIDVQEVRALAGREPSGLPEHPFFIVPRRLVHKTGVRFAIEAMAELRDLDVCLLVAGQGPLRGELEALAGRLGLGQRVRFLGSVPRSRVLPLFGRAVAVLVPSVPASGVVEATSLAVSEAMACDTVPIASGIGGLAEMIRDGQSGLLVPPGDAKALAHAMRSVFVDADLRRRLVEGGMRQAEKEFDVDPWLDKTESVYRSVLSGASARGGHA